MRLASKIFLTSSLVILVLAGVGALSLGAVGRLVSVNREITTQTVPALRVSSGLRDQMLSLARLEARYSVLKDARYATAWRARAAQADDEFDRLRTLVRTPRERALLAEAAAAVGAYRGGRRLLPRADPGRRARRDRRARALLQCHGRAAAPYRRDQGGVLRHALARAALAAHLGARGGAPAARRRARLAQRQAGAPG